MDLHIKRRSFSLVDFIVAFMDWKICFYRQYFVDISDIGRPRKDIEHRLSNGRNIGKISGKSPKYRRYIGLEPINRQKNQAWSDVWSSGGSLLKYRRYIGDILDISANRSDISANRSDISPIYLRNIRDFFESFFIF